MEVYTAGFTKWLAKDFFNLLENLKINKLIDIRLRPNSQLSGFTRGVNFSYFLENLSNVKYEHQIKLAPTKELLNKRRNEGLNWQDFESEYVKLLDKDILNYCLNEISNQNILFLCSETEPQFCHRRILTDKLCSFNPNLEIVHLVPK